MILTTYSAKRRALVSTYGLKGKHGEPSLITNLFRNLAWILITGVMLFPQDNNTLPLEDLISHPKKTTRTDMSVPGRSVTARILVLEEHPLLRDGMTDFLNAQLDLQVCGEAGNI